MGVTGAVSVRVCCIVSMCDELLECMMLSDNDRVLVTCGEGHDVVGLLCAYHFWIFFLEVVFGQLL